MIVKIVFLNKNKKGSKIYDFRCHYALEIGDIIQDPRYKNPMLVVGLADKSSISDDLLKTIIITKINKKENIMEKRNLQISLEQAREWYTSDNDVLKTLALSVFSEEELILNRDYIFNKMQKELSIFTIATVCEDKLIVLTELSIIAKYFNGDWKKTSSNTGYFLGQVSQGFAYSATLLKDSTLKNVGILKHDTVMYPGIIYFKNIEDLNKAVKIMGDRIKCLFK